jgi:hypothetical protein
LNFPGIVLAPADSLLKLFEQFGETFGNRLYKRSGSMFASPGNAGGARDIVAKHIIELARGIMDRHQLSADAVANLANSYRYERVVDPRRKAALF